MPKPIIAPLIITVISVCYFLFWLAACWLQSGLSVVAKLLGGVVAFSFIGLSVVTLVERIQEIRSGEEDDARKY